MEQVTDNTVLRSEATKVKVMRSGKPQAQSGLHVKNGKSFYVNISWE